MSLTSREAGVRVSRSDAIYIHFQKRGFFFSLLFLRHLLEDGATLYGEISNK